MQVKAKTVTRDERQRFVDLCVHEIADAEIVNKFIRFADAVMSAQRRFSPLQIAGITAGVIAAMAAGLTLYRTYRAAHNPVINTPDEPISVEGVLSGVEPTGQRGITPRTEVIWKNTLFARAVGDQCQNGGVVLQKAFYDKKQLEEETELTFLFGENTADASPGADTDYPKARTSAWPAGKKRSGNGGQAAALAKYNRKNAQGIRTTKYGNSRTDLTTCFIDDLKKAEKIVVNGGIIVIPVFSSDRFENKDVVFLVHSGQPSYGGARCTLDASQRAQLVRESAWMVQRLQKSGYPVVELGDDEYAVRAIKS